MPPPRRTPRDGLTDDERANIRTAVQALPPMTDRQIADVCEVIAAAAYTNPTGGCGQVLPAPPACTGTLDLP
jgi:hypothetical protein